MIARIWQGRTRPGLGKKYMSYLEKTGLKQYKETDGCREVIVLTRSIGEVTEYVLITLWDNVEAVRRFTGFEPERAVYYPQDEYYFPKEQLTPYVHLFDVAV